MAVSVTPRTLPPATAGQTDKRTMHRETKPIHPDRLISSSPYVLELMACMS
jgi:hypothetical protein